MVKFIHGSDLGQIARKVWYAKWAKASRDCQGKVASFENMGYESRSTEFPMKAHEWVKAGKLEISISYPMWDIPGYIRVRKAQVS